MLYGTRIEIELYVFSDLTQTQKDTGTLTNAKYSATWKRQQQNRTFLIKTNSTTQEDKSNKQTMM